MREAKGMHDFVSNSANYPTFWVTVIIWIAQLNDGIFSFEKVMDGPCCIAIF
jgi:hypothetical protein